MWTRLIFDHLTLTIRLSMRLTLMCPPLKCLCVLPLQLSLKALSSFLFYVHKRKRKPYSFWMAETWYPKKIRDWDSHINGLAKISSPSDHKREKKELKFFTFQGFKRGPWDLHFHLAYLSSFLIASGQDSCWFKMNLKTINWQMREKFKIISMSCCKNWNGVCKRYFFGLCFQSLWFKIRPNKCLLLEDWKED